MLKPGGSPQSKRHGRISPIALFKQASNSLYRYTRIRSDQIRLLVIKPAHGAPNDPLNATLRTVEDDQSASDDYKYAALSYNWGDGDAEDTIIIQDDLNANPITSIHSLVNGAMAEHGLRSKKLLIRSNLHEALKQLRQLAGDQRLMLWVDALCINQADEVEKQEQVMKMAKIYRNAKHVCIWLGSDESEDRVSDTAMKFIKEAIAPNNYQALINEQRYIPKWASFFELLRWSW